MPRSRKHSRTVRKNKCRPTGVCRYFFKLELLSKLRARPVAPFHYGEPDPVVDTPPSSSDDLNPFVERENVTSAISIRRPISPPPPGKTYKVHGSRGVRVALMNEDVSENAVIITTLDDVPFCCHEDLLTMPRDKLVGVASALNARLPASMAIDTGHVLPNSIIRASIERLVGLRPSTPSVAESLQLASQKLLLEQPDNVATDKTLLLKSSLARDTQSYGNISSLLSSRLARLEEEDELEAEGEEFDRHTKNQTLSPVKIDDLNDSDVDMEAMQTPTPLPRIQRAWKQRELMTKDDTHVIQAHTTTTLRNEHSTFRRRNKKSALTKQEIAVARIEEVDD